MELTLLCLISLITLLIYITHNFLEPSRRGLPPYPAMPLPILGHLHLLKPPLHRHLHRLSQKNGPIFYLKLGFRRLVVITSSALAEECFTGKNDVVFANRPSFLVDKYLSYNYSAMSGACYGDHWRTLRRIAALELLSTNRINSFIQVRRDEIKRLLLGLHGTSGPVELRPRLSELTFNVMMRMIAGKRYVGKNEGDQGKKFTTLIAEAFELAQSSNPQDFLPILQLVDYGGYTRRMIALAEKLDEFYQSLIDEQREEKRNTMIGHLLTLQESEPELYTDLTIKGLISNMIFAGTETSMTTIEWAMSNLLNHPEVLAKARTELDNKVGHHRLINEEDLPSLPCLSSIIWETLRLFPPGPVLIPHQSSKDCKVGGYNVPGGTILIVNVWAIHRDPEICDDPMSFKPVRFQGKEIETNKFFPFGMGRRACPGSNLGLRMVGLALGSLIQCFEWARVGSEEVDLAEGVGLSMPKLKPLEVMCKPREIMQSVIQEA